MSTLFKWRNENPFTPGFTHFFDDVIHAGFPNKIDLGTTVPAANIREGIKHYAIDMAIPGMAKENFQIEISDDNVITISANTEQSKNENSGDKVTRREYSFQSFSRSFSLPEDAHRENIGASYENGILTIQVAKKDDKKVQSENRRIEVK